MRADELAGDELVPRLTPERVVPVRIVRVAQLRDEGVALVHQRHAPVQIRDHDQALTLVEVAGQPEAGDEVDVLPVHA